MVCLRMFVLTILHDLLLQYVIIVQILSTIQFISEYVGTYI